MPQVVQNDLFTIPNCHMQTIWKEDDLFANIGHSILESVQDGISILNPELNIMYVNTSMRNWYSGSDKMINHKCFSVYHGRRTVCENCPSVAAIRSGAPCVGILCTPTSFHQVYAVPIIDSHNEVRCIIEYVRDITALTKMRQEFDRLIAELEGLTQKNDLLMKIIEHYQNQQEELEQTIVHNVDKFVRPTLEYLQKKNSTGNESDLINNLLRQFVYPITKKRATGMEHLTPREWQVALLLKEGQTSKEISDSLHISKKTVDFHRGSIRKKLKIEQSNAKTSLCSYLKTYL